MSTAELPRTVAESVFVAAHADPERIALRYKVAGEWRDETVAALAERVHALTAGLIASGIQPGERVCVLTHQNWLTLVKINDELNYVRRDDVVYLFLPLAHVFAQLEQFACLAAGATLVYFGGDVKQVVAEIAEVRPTFLPSVPRVFEK